ncbi:hypothetical protein GGG16DRAFT_34565, partial [Schizophyllum commune]
SLDLRARVPVLFYDQHRPVFEICEVLGMKKTLVYTILRQHRSYGLCYNPLARRAGRRQKLNHIDKQFLLALLHKYRTLYLDEIQENLAVHRNVYVHLTTIFRALQRLQVTRKVVSARAAERNEHRRAAFWLRIADLVTDPNQIMCTDESASDKRTHARRYGWSLQGLRCTTRR